ncbi:MAG: DUF4292 domain-containing protein [Thermodesulfobacteriota bacterium]|nr:DUF4292 domain-containing protein [Thermodesulfobacteriota bacterium]
MIQGFAGQGRLQFKNQRSRYSFDLTVAAMRPDRLRLQTYNFLGRPVMTLTVNQKELSLLDYRKATLYRGPPTRGNLGRFLPLNLDISEIISLLGGAHPISSFAQADVYRDTEFEIGREFWCLSLVRPGGHLVERIWMVPPHLRVSRVEIGPPNGDALFRLDFSDYRDVAGLAMPFQIFVEDLKARNEFTIDYEEFQIYSTLPDRIFSLPLPPGFKAVPFPDRESGGS